MSVTMPITVTSLRDTRSPVHSPISSRDRD